MLPENFNTIDAVVAEIRHSKVGSLVSSGLQSVACWHTQLVCLHVFTRIVLTAKQSFSRTHRLLQNVLCTLTAKKHCLFYELGEGLPISGCQVPPPKNNSLIYWKMGAIWYKVRLLEAKQIWHFECLSFKKKKNWNSNSLNTRVTVMKQKFEL